MEELPSLQSVIAPKGASITIRMKVGIPVFLSPNVPAAIAGTVKDAAVRDGAISFDVVNTGNTHFAIQKVRVTGKDSAGGDVFSQELTGWYVLAGETRHFTVPVTKDRCAALASLAVAVRADALSFANSFSDLVKQCGPVSQR
jgi:fimbrial chaperone protein